jgi:hypothetical protein
MKLSVGLIIILLALFAVPADADNDASPEARVDDRVSYTKAIEKWRAERLEEINGEDGWTTCRHSGSRANRFGSDPSNDLILPRTSASRFAGHRPSAS